MASHRKTSAAKTSITLVVIEPLIQEYDGNVAAVARKLGVSRDVIYRRIQTSETLKQVREDAREALVDDAEEALHQQIKNGNITAIIFFLKCQAKNRGYVERQEMTGADGGPIRVIKAEDLSDDDLAAIAAGKAR